MESGAVSEEEKDFEPHEEYGEDEGLEEGVEEGGSASFELRQGSELLSY